MIKRRQFLQGLLTAPFYFSFMDRVRALGVRPVRSPRPPSQPFKLAFGSCSDQDLPQPVWNLIASHQPDAFAFIGDNIYADTDDMSVMAAKYRQFAENKEFAEFRSQVPVIATWDDHDFGFNDAGREYPFKQESKDMMLQFFGEPEDSPRRKRDGVYTSYFFGEAPQKLQVILLDLRWFRTTLKMNENGEYIPNDDLDATMLGEEQWLWLEDQLSQPADFRVLASSIQLVSSDHRWEKWANFPRDKQRLMEMIDRLNIQNMVVISGDMHFAELSVEKTPAGFDLYDLTSSGLNYFEPAGDIPNSNRIQLFDSDCQFGIVTVDWVNTTLALQIFDLQNNCVIERLIKIPGVNIAV